MQIVSLFEQILFKKAIGAQESKQKRSQKLSVFVVKKMGENLSSPERNINMLILVYPRSEIRDVRNVLLWNV